MKKTLSTPRPSSPSENSAANPITPQGKPAPAKFTPRGSKKERILVAITDGKIDFSQMSPEATKDLNTLLHLPDVQAQFGIGPLSQKFDPSHCVRLYQALGKIFATGTRVALNWPAAAAEKLEYTESECKELSIPTASVLDQYGNKFLQENQSVLALALVFSAITQNKVQQAIAIVAAEKQKTAAPGPSPRPAIVPPAAGQAREARPIG